MSRVVLVALPDEAAADLVRTTLAEAGIAGSIERAHREHPYAGAPAAPWKVLVAEEHLNDAQSALARLEMEMAEEVEAQAAVAEVDAADPDAPRAAGVGAGPADTTDPRRRPRTSVALALALLVFFPAVCLYARAWRRGAILIGIFAAALALLLARAIWDYWPAALGGDGLLSVGDQLLLVFMATKLGDLFIGLPRVVLLRRQARRAAAVATPA
jgi:hypothetical protein